MVYKLRGTPSLGTLLTVLRCQSWQGEGWALGATSAASPRALAGPAMPLQ